MNHRAYEYKQLVGADMSDGAVLAQWSPQAAESPVPSGHAPP
jgi:hypothetical protein